MTRLSTACRSDTSYGRIREAMEVFDHLEILLHGPYYEVVVAPACDHLVIRTESDRSDSPKIFKTLKWNLLSIADLQTAHKQLFLKVPNEDLVVLASNRQKGVLVALFVAPSQNANWPAMLVELHLRLAVTWLPDAD